MPGKGPIKRYTLTPVLLLVVPVIIPLCIKSFNIFSNWDSSKSVFSLIWLRFKEGSLKIIRNLACSSVMIIFNSSIRVSLMGIGIWPAFTIVSVTLFHKFLDIIINFLQSKMSNCFKV